MAEMTYNEIIRKIELDAKLIPAEGLVASYIPELAKISPDHFGFHLQTTGELEYSFGENDIPFSIQSISKVFTLAYALAIRGESIWERVGVEPSGNRFNSIVQLEYELGIPRNPFLNAGALVMADILLSELENPYDDYLEFVQALAGNEEIGSNFLVARSELSTGYMNASLANFLKHYDNIHNEITEVLEYYYFQCALEMSCRDLARAFKAFADHEEPFSFAKVSLPGSQVKRINAVMQTCGFYDEAGEFAYRVGLPGKSGVGGGIVAIHPLRYAVAVWSPPLNERGNSVKGMRTLEMLTSLTGNSIF